MTSSKYFAPIVDKIDLYTPEEAIGARLILEILVELRSRGIYQVSRAEILETLGCEDEIQPGDEDKIIELTEEYLDNKTAIDASIDARVAPKH